MTWHPQKKCLRVISCIIISCFINQDIVWAQAGTLVWPKATNEGSAAKTASTSIAIPKDAAVTKESYAGNGATIINIQDAHSSLSAQESIANIIDSLVTNYDLRVVGIEGSTGYIDTSLLKTFPNEKARKDTAQRLMAEGRMSAGEFYSVTSGKDIALYGVEEKALYGRNVEEFRRVLELGEALKGDINRFIKALEALEEKTYSQDLIRIAENERLHRDGESSFTERIKSDTAIANSVIARSPSNSPRATKQSNPAQGEIASLTSFARNDEGVAYPNLAKFNRCLAAEKTINFENANRQRDNLIDALSKKIAKDDLEKLVLKSVSFKAGKIGQAEFYAFVQELAAKEHIDPAPYKDLITYAGYISLYESIDLAEIMNEAKALEELVEGRLFTSPDQRKLHDLTECAGLIKWLFEIKLDNADLAGLEELLKTCSGEYAARFIREMSEKQGVPIETADIGAIYNAIPEALKFYKTAEERNNALLSNTIRRMKDEGRTVAAVITGGYHTKGISELLKSRNASYIVILPKFDASKGDRPYVAILTKRKAAYEHLVKGGTHYIATSAYFETDPSVPAEKRLLAYRDDLLAALKEETKDLKDRKRAYALSAATVDEWAARYRSHYDAFTRRQAEGRAPGDFVAHTPAQVEAFLRSDILAALFPGAPAKKKTATADEKAAAARAIISNFIDKTRVPFLAKDESAHELSIREVIGLMKGRAAMLGKDDGVSAKAVKELALGLANKINSANSREEFVRLAREVSGEALDHSDVIALKNVACYSVNHALYLISLNTEFLMSPDAAREELEQNARKCVENIRDLEERLGGLAGLERFEIFKNKLGLDDMVFPYKPLASPIAELAPGVFLTGGRYFQAFIDPLKAAEYYNIARLEISGQVFSRSSKSVKYIVALLREKNRLSECIIAMGKADKPRALDLYMDTQLTRQTAHFDIKTARLLQIIEEAINIRGPDRFKAIRGRVTIALIDKSASLFEDHIQNGFIGVNRVIFETVARAFPEGKRQAALEALLAVGITHELLHEAGEIDEAALTDDDVLCALELAKARSLDPTALRTGLDAVVQKSVFRDRLWSAMHGADRAPEAPAATRQATPREAEPQKPSETAAAEAQPRPTPKLPGISSWVALTQELEEISKLDAAAAVLRIENLVYLLNIPGKIKKAGYSADRLVELDNVQKATFLILGRNDLLKANYALIRQLIKELPRISENKHQLIRDLDGMIESFNENWLPKSGIMANLRSTIHGHLSSADKIAVYAYLHYINTGDMSKLNKLFTDHIGTFVVDKEDKEFRAAIEKNMKIRETMRTRPDEPAGKIDEWADRRYDELKQMWKILDEIFPGQIADAEKFFAQPEGGNIETFAAKVSEARQESPVSGQPDIVKELEKLESALTGADNVKRLEAVHDARAYLYDIIMLTSEDRLRLRLIELDADIEHIGYLIGAMVYNQATKNISDRKNLEAALKATSVLIAMFKMDGLASLRLRQHALMLAEPDLTYLQLYNVLNAVAEAYRALHKDMSLELEAMAKLLVVGRVASEDEAETVQKYVLNIMRGKRNLRLINDFIDALEEFARKEKIDEKGDDVSYTGVKAKDETRLPRVSELTSDRLAARGIEDVWSILGAKGAAQIDMTREKIAVPPFFICPTTIPKHELERKYTEALKGEIMSAIRGPGGLEEQMRKFTGAEAKFGDTNGRPLLISVRSGSTISMPGIMNTVLDVGMNSRIAEAWANQADSWSMATMAGRTRVEDHKWFVYDSYLRFLVSYASNVYDMHELTLQNILQKEYDVDSTTDLYWADLKKLTAEVERKIKEKYSDFEKDLEDPTLQVVKAVYAVFYSWNGDSAQEYRKREKISNKWKTAAIVQAMVYGNYNELSGTGVIITCKDREGNITIVGDYLTKAQGEDIVSGAKTGKPIAELETECDCVYDELIEHAKKIDEMFGSRQEIEFTFENGRLWILQARPWREQPETELREFEDPSGEFACGTGAYGGAFRGLVALGFENAEALAAEARAKGLDGVVIILPQGDPRRDGARIFAVDALVTKSARNSHIAAIAAHHGKVCVARVNCAVAEEKARFFSEEDRLAAEFKEGEVISIDGKSGKLYKGKKMLKGEEGADGKNALLLQFRGQPVPIDSTSPKFAARSELAEQLMPEFVDAFLQQVPDQLYNGWDRKTIIHDIGYLRYVISRAYQHSLKCLALLPQTGVFVSNYESAGRVRDELMVTYQDAEAGVKGKITQALESHKIRIHGDYSVRMTLVRDGRELSFVHHIYVISRRDGKRLSDEEKAKIYVSLKTLELVPPKFIIGIPRSKYSAREIATAVDLIEQFARGAVSVKILEGSAGSRQELDAELIKYAARENVPAEHIYLMYEPKMEPSLIIAALSRLIECEDLSRHVLFMDRAKRLAIAEGTPDKLDEELIAKAAGDQAKVKRYLMYAYNHVERVAAIAELIGKKLGIPDNEMKILLAAAEVHDGPYVDTVAGKKVERYHGGIKLTADDRAKYTTLKRFFAHLRANKGSRLTREEKDTARDLYDHGERVISDLRGLGITITPEVEALVRYHQYPSEFFKDVETYKGKLSIPLDDLVLLLTILTTADVFDYGQGIDKMEMIRDGKPTETFDETFAYLAKKCEKEKLPDPRPREALAELIGERDEELLRIVLKARGEGATLKPQDEAFIAAQTRAPPASAPAAQQPAPAAAETPALVVPAGREIPVEEGRKILEAPDFGNHTTGAVVFKMDLPEHTRQAVINDLHGRGIDTCRFTRVEGPVGMATVVQLWGAGFEKSFASMNKAGIDISEGRRTFEEAKKDGSKADAFAAWVREIYRDTLEHPERYNAEGKKAVRILIYALECLNSGAEVLVLRSALNMEQLRRIYGKHSFQTILKNNIVGSTDVMRADASSLRGSVIREELGKKDPSWKPVRLALEFNIPDNVVSFIVNGVHCATLEHAKEEKGIYLALSQPRAPPTAPATKEFIKLIPKGRQPVRYHPDDLTRILDKRQYAVFTKGLSRLRKDFPDAAEGLRLKDIEVWENLTELAAFKDSGIDIDVTVLGNPLATTLSIYHERLHELLKTARTAEDEAKRAPEDIFYEEVFVVGKVLEYLYSGKIKPQERSVYLGFLRRLVKKGKLYGDFNRMIREYNRLMDKSPAGVAALIAKHVKAAYSYEDGWQEVLKSVEWLDKRTLVAEYEKMAADHEKKLMKVIRPKATMPEIAMIIGLAPDAPQSSVDAVKKAAAHDSGIAVVRVKDESKLGELVSKRKAAVGIFLDGSVSADMIAGENLKDIIDAVRNNRFFRANPALLTLNASNISGKTREELLEILAIVGPHLPAIAKGDMDKDLVAALENRGYGKIAAPADLSRLISQKVSERKGQAAFMYNQDAGETLGQASQWSEKTGRAIAMATTEKVAESDIYIADNIAAAAEKGIANCFIYGELFDSVEKAQAFLRASGYDGDFKDIVFVDKRSYPSYDDLIKGVQDQLWEKASAYVAIDDIGIRAVKEEVRGKTEAPLSGRLMEIADKDGVPVAMNTYQVLLKILTGFPDGVSFEDAIAALGKTIPGLSYDKVKHVFSYLPPSVPADYRAEVEAYRRAVKFVLTAA